MVIYSSPKFGFLLFKNEDTPSTKSGVKEELVINNFSNSS